MDVCIIGGGASGMILASKLKKHNITIIERNNKLGKKLLLTGNGKCNFTNLDFNDLNEIYNNDFARNIYKKYDNLSFINYFKSIGIVPKVEIHKGIRYVYPNCNKATGVYYSLLDKIIANDVNILYNTKVFDIKIINNKFHIYTDNNKSLEFDKIVLSTGGMSYKNTGSDGNGYDLAKKLSHSIVAASPGLCALIHNDHDLKKLKGVRVDSKVFLIYNNKIYEEFGEVQFNECSVSGIPIMNLSRKIDKSNIKSQNITVVFDFSAPLYKILDLTNYDNDYYKILDNNYDSIKNELIKRRDNLSYRTADYFLNGFLPDELSYLLCKKLNFNSNSIKTISDNDIDSLIKLITHFEVRIVDTSGFDSAQITLGGVNTHDVNSDTLESKLTKNLYFTGEILDIDGKCGGYNLQLAYSTASIVADNI